MILFEIISVGGVDSLSRGPTFPQEPTLVSFCLGCKKIPRHLRTLSVSVGTSCNNPFVTFPFSGHSFYLIFDVFRALK